VEFSVECDIRMINGS